MAENKFTGIRTTDLLASPTRETKSVFDFTGNVFTRRFFLVDKVSGVSNNTLRVIRVPTQISLW
jgi:hypothetical protein